MNSEEYKTYTDTLTFLINGKRQNLCWIMSHCSIERSDEWRDKQFKRIQDELDMLVAELELAKSSFGDMNV